MEQTFVRQVLCQSLSLTALIYFTDYKTFRNPSNPIYTTSLHATPSYLMRIYMTKWLLTNCSEADRTQGMATRLLSDLHSIQAEAISLTALSMEMCTVVRIFFSLLGCV